jgi:hypothetical protein
MTRRSLWTEIAQPKSQMGLQPQLETREVELPRTVVAVAGQSSSPVAMEGGGGGNRC